MLKLSLLLFAASVQAQKSSSTSSTSEGTPIISNTGPPLSSTTSTFTNTISSDSLTITVSTGTVSVTTAVPTLPSTASADTLLPTQVALPPKQSWCPSEIFCAGSLLQTVNLAHVFVDDKTFVDKPTSKKAATVVSDFTGLGQNITYGAIQSFVETDFKGEGLELSPLPPTNNFQAPPDPAFVAGIKDPLVKAWSQTVNGFWNQLIRTTNNATLCGSGSDCESSLIPLNHTFVVPGGRFREQYYWDSFWIVEGLLESGLYDIAKGTLDNFMDEIERFGFIPNGGRIYYLNRSQPPLFIHMLANYVKASNDTAILTRGLKMAEAELKWWTANRMVNVTSPFSNTTYTMARYHVTNTAPRPESYSTDYTTATASGQLNETQRSALYAELASGAESGWDYSSRWLQAPVAGSADLTTLQVRDTIPICLNSILYNAYTTYSTLSNTTTYVKPSLNLRAGILDLFWDSSKLAFYDYNLKTNARNNVFSAAHFYPLWLGIVPDDLKDSQKAFGAFSSLNLVLTKYNGTFPVTFIDTGLQWDAPNTWPPHQYVALKALQALSANATSSALPTADDVFSLVPQNQLGVDESALPVQTISSTANSTQPNLNHLNGTVINGGVATEGEGWGKALERMLANRYFASAFCSWHATGGEIPGVLPRLSDQELNVTQSIGNTGNMFEKFSVVDIDSAGRGGEYTVQAGFGWTNGVLLWVASNYGDVLVAPQCPNLLESPAAGNGGNGTTGNGGNNTTTSGSTGGQGNAAIVSKELKFGVGWTLVVGGLIAALMV